jgi:FMN-dependent oxidoreductase (nitrilotriacetate monooxygenase family)
MKPKKMISFGFIPKETPYSWRHDGAYAESDHDFDHYRHIAQEAERGLFDLIFCADSVALRDDGIGMEHLAGTGTAAYLDGLTLIAALAAVTTRIGIAATASTTYHHPYHLARQLATVDHISKGRAGWNVITSGQTSEALNFGYDAQVERNTRYERARECLETVFDLWDSWEDGAVLRDKASGRYFDPDKIHRLDHHGPHFKLRGPLNITRPPQGHPVICQAGGSAISSFHSRLPRPLLPASTASPASAQAIFAEGLGRQRHPGVQRLDHRVGIDADFVLGMRIGAQPQESSSDCAGRSSSTIACRC